jgi:hypothetical protein
VLLLNRCIKLVVPPIKDADDFLKASEKDYVDTVNQILQDNDIDPSRDNNYLVREASIWMWQIDYCKIHE